MLDASSFFCTSYVFAVIIVTGAIGLAPDRGIAWLNRQLVHWEEKC